MHQKNSIHYHHWLKSEIVEIYLNLAIRSFALSLGVIFIPIYLLNLGYGVNQLFAYYISVFAVFGAASVLVAKIGRKIGLKHLIIISIPFSIVFFILLFMLNNIDMTLLYSISFVEGLSSAFYWIPLNTLFAKYIKSKKASKQVSYIFSVPGMVSIVGPIVGGSLILLFGFKVLLLVISILLFTSLIPLFVTKDFKPHKDFSLKRILTKDNLKYFGGFFIHGIISVSGTILWPLFVFFVLRDVFSLGIIGTLGAISIVFFPLMLSKIQKKFTLLTLFKVGGFVAFIVFSLVPLARSAVEVYVASLFIGIILILVEMPFYTLAIKKAAKKNPLEFMIFREIALSIGRITILAFLLIFGADFFAGFSITGATSLLSLVL